MKNFLNRLFAVSAFAGVSFTSAQTVGTVINAADATTAFCPGMVILIRGTALAGGSATISALPAPTTLAGATVRFTASDGSSSSLPLLQVTPTEIRAQLPYDVALGSATLSVSGSTAAGISLTAIAPRFITNFQDGSGDLLMFHSNPQRQVTRLDPARPGETVWAFMHGMGQTNPAVVAGADPGLNPSPAVLQPVTVTVNGLQTQVTEATLLELNPGVYKVAVLLPYDENFGTVPILLQEGAVSAQTSSVIPYTPNGFYYQILANSPPAPIGLNGISGASSAIATRHNALNYWGANGFLNWTKATGLPSVFEPIRGIAMTLQSNGATVFANQRIEAGDGAFSNNANGVADGNAPGLLTVFSMSNLYNFVGGGFFRLSQPVTFDTIMGYFDGNGDRDLPLDPSSPYIQYRMNIWSNVAASNTPVENGTFRGNVWSSDLSTGTWAWSNTGVSRVFRDTPTLSGDLTRRDDPIFRMVYTLNTPFTLPAGDYWFSHDAVVPTIGAFGFFTDPLNTLTRKKAAPVRESPAAGERAFPTALLRFIP